MRTMRSPATIGTPAALHHQLSGSHTAQEEKAQKAQDAARLKMEQVWPALGMARGSGAAGGEAR